MLISIFKTVKKLTKFSKAIPIPNQEANTISKEFVTKIILEHGIPEKILTDQGTNFLSEIFKNTCKLLKINKIQTTAYHPESNGALEKSHRTLAEYLRHCGRKSDGLGRMATVRNVHVQHDAAYSDRLASFELVYGHQADLPTALTKPPKPTYNYDDYAQELKERLRAINRFAREHIKDEKTKAKIQYDKKAKEIIFKIGDKILI